MSNNQLYTQLLERVLADRPELAPYAELFQQMAAGSETDHSAKEMEIRLRKVSGIARQLKAELDYALNELDDFAKALGACHHCCGEDNRCHICRGQGQPGYFKPDRLLFDRLILPALREVSWIEIKEK
jgi:hypothetical protein